MAIGGIRARMRSIAARKLNVDYVLGFSANYAAGFGDRFGTMCLPLPLVLLGVNPVGAIRDLTPGGAAVDNNSSAYRAGGDSATIVTFVLSVGASAGSAGSRAAVQNGSSRLQATKEALLDWLGPGARRVGNSGSDLMAQSADRTRSIRFDLIGSHGDAPHINVQTWQPRNLFPGDTRMIELTNTHIYPK
jgi:hypothetical protein